MARQRRRGGEARVPAGREGPSPAEVRTLRRSALLVGASAEVVDRLVRVGHVEPRARHDVLYHDGDASLRCFVVLFGRIRVARVAGDGREVVLAHRLAGDVVGEWGLLGQPTQRETAEVAEDARLLVLPVSAVVPVLEGNSRLLRGLVGLAASRRLEAEARLEALLFRTVRSRLAEFLVECARCDGAADPRGTRIRSRYTHLEIASTVGATRETVTLALAEMRRRGLLVIERRRLIVRDAAKLRALV